MSLLTALCISSAIRDDNCDSFITPDEVSAVRCQVITLNKAVRPHHHNLITALLNHCIGSRWRRKEERVVPM